MPRNAAWLKPSLAVEHLHMRCEIARADCSSVTDSIAAQILDHVSQVSVICSERCL